MHPLPALCNWLCHLAYPDFKVAERKFVEPFYPHSTIGILHLAGVSKDLSLAVRDESDGSKRDLALRFRGSDEISDQALNGLQSVHWTYSGDSDGRIR